MPSLGGNEEYNEREAEEFSSLGKDVYEKVHAFALEKAEEETDKQHIKPWLRLFTILIPCIPGAGAQTPFSSINYGMDTSPEGRMVIKNVLLATEAGLGFGETAIFPIHIFRVKEGINYNPGDPNYDLFQLQ